MLPGRCGIYSKVGTKRLLLAANRDFPLAAAR